MKPIQLTLTSPKGDVLGNRTLSDVQLAEARDPDGETARQEGEMSYLTRRVRETLAGEGMVVLMDDISLQIVAGRALLAASGTDKVEVRLPVQESPLLRSDKTDDQRGNAADEEPEIDTSFLDRLFDLDADDDPDSQYPPAPGDQTEGEGEDE